MNMKIHRSKGHEEGLPTNIDSLSSWLSTGTVDVVGCISVEVFNANLNPMTRKFFLAGDRDLPGALLTIRMTPLGDVVKAIESIAPPTVTTSVL